MLVHRRVTPRIKFAWVDRGSGWGETLGRATTKTPAENPSTRTLNETQ